MSYYNYHAQIKKLLDSGRLVSIEKSKHPDFSFYFVFDTEKGIIRKPIRPHAVYRYEEYLKDFINKF